jgi:two-component system, OmpR family, response regulator
MNAFLNNTAPARVQDKNLICVIASDEVHEQINVAINGLHCEVVSANVAASRPALVIIELGEAHPGIAAELATLRAKWTGIQVIGLASWQSLYDGKLAPSCVVDDLLFLPAKPVDFQYRIRRHLSNQLDLSSADAILTFGSVQFDLQSLQIKISDKKLSVTKREYELLLYFARQAPRPVSHREIADKVLKLAQSITTYENVINVHIARVRGKLKEISEENRLKTLRGSGFLFHI